MDELILSALQERLTPAEALRLDSWRKASPVNEQYYQDMVRLWDSIPRQDPLVERVAATIAATPSWADLQARASSDARDVRTAPQRAWQWSRWAGAVAVAALLLLMVRVADEPPIDTSRSTEEFRASEFVTDQSEMVTASLADGSVVRLAPESRLRVTPAINRREVWLDGEAFFAVARDSVRPFSVRTRAGSVEVLGTRFDLQVVGSELRLVVTEGKVALVSGAHRQTVVAGQIARVRDGGPPQVEGAVAVDSVLAWTRGFIVFQNTPLHQVAAELEQRYGARVLLPDSTIASRTVTAWFTNQGLDQVLSAICRAVDAHCSLRDNVASIEP
ncbi:FecR domain-containing protein [Gemmatimonas aurantiaca]|uniref:FecR family protein n=1 Tax=Gemmatimonas aurantiaca TaxID=173480 RepID=UPI00301D5265